MELSTPHAGWRLDIVVADSWVTGAELAQVAHAALHRAAARGTDGITVHGVPPLTNWDDPQFRATVWVDTRPA